MQRALPAATVGNLVPPARGYPYFQGWEAGWLAPEAAFGPKNAWSLAEAALLAYDTDANVEAAVAGSPLARAGFRAEPRLSGRRTGYFVLRGAEVAVVSFRGTQLVSFFDALADFATDAMLVPKADLRGGGRAHSGFLDALEPVWEALVRSLRGTGPVLLTGHSLGGALATLAARWAIAERAFDVRGLCTFGAPRVGDAAFVEGLEEGGLAQNMLRVVNNADLVPHLPPELFYRHAGRLLRFDATGNAQGIAPEEHSFGLGEVLASVGPDLQALLAFARDPRAPSDLPLPRPLADHAPVYYALRAWNNLDRAIG